MKKEDMIWRVADDGEGIIVNLWEAYRRDVLWYSLTAHYLVDEDSDLWKDECYDCADFFLEDELETVADLYKSTHEHYAEEAGGSGLDASDECYGVEGEWGQVVWYVNNFYLDCTDHDCESCPGCGLYRVVKGTMTEAYCVAVEVRRLS